MEGGKPEGWGKTQLSLGRNGCRSNISGNRNWFIINVWENLGLGVEEFAIEGRDER